MRAHASRFSWLGVWVVFVVGGLLQVLFPRLPPATAFFVWTAAVALGAFAFGQASARGWRPREATGEPTIATAAGLLAVIAGLVAERAFGAGWSFRAGGVVLILGGLLGTAWTLARGR